LIYSVLFEHFTAVTACLLLEMEVASILPTRFGQLPIRNLKLAKKKPGRLIFLPEKKRQIGAGCLNFQNMLKNVKIV
jgi:hypothetical protein